MFEYTVMKITLPKIVLEFSILKELKAEFGINPENFLFGGTVLRLYEFSPDKVTRLVELLTPHNDKQPIRVVLADIRRYELSLKSGGDVKPRSLEQLPELFGEWLKDTPRHWLFTKKYDDDENSPLVPVYLCKVRYHNSYRNDDKPYVSFEFNYEEFGVKKSDSFSLYSTDARGGRSLSAILLEQGYIPATEELIEQYLQQLAWFNAIMDLPVGTQYWCSGLARNDVDGNDKGRDNSWYWRRTSTLDMSAFGEPSRVLRDIFFEDPDEENRNSRHRDKADADGWFWMERLKRKKKKSKPDDDDEDEDEVRGKLEDNLTGDNYVPDVPVHPMLAVFDLKRHERLRVHASNLTRYVYDTGIAERLVIPDSHRALIRLLIQHQDGGFKDIVRGKSGGAVVLLTGRPGVGKTLTAEVYAEAEQRGLFSVQCSQLGTDPEELEESLLKVFSRAKRWNAVMLLDEADVYVRTRGQDLVQNAIVGVFLRVLEYQSSVLFLTTNRPKDVDDAIASRCIARIHYRTPSKESQRNIWKILTESSGTVLEEDELIRILEAHPDLSGRDIKNLIKLSRLGLAGGAMTCEVVDFVKQFRPTGTETDETDDDRDLEIPPPIQLIKAFPRRKRKDS